MNRTRSLLFKSLIVLILGTLSLDCQVEADDAEIIRQIQNLREKCNAAVFRDAESDLMVLWLEWRKIQDEAIDVYVRHHPERPRPHGTFLKYGVSANQILAFYSHNKHFEVLVAEALTGPERKHVEFGSVFGGGFSELKWLRPKYFVQQTQRADYEKLGRDIATEFTSHGLGESPEIDASNRDNRCVVNSPWKSLQTINEIEYLQRIVHEVAETTGITLTPNEVFSGDSSRMQFSTYIEVRRASEPDGTKRFGPIGCDLVARDVHPDVQSDMTAVSMGPTTRLELDRLPAGTRDSVPDLDYWSRIAKGSLDCSAAAMVEKLQRSIDERVQKPNE